MLWTNIKEIRNNVLAISQKIVVLRGLFQTSGIFKILLSQSDHIFKMEPRFPNNKIHLKHFCLNFQVTECEIFLSLIVKFLDPDKPVWQRSLALEVLHQLVVDAKIVRAFCECYDLKAHSTNIFQDIVNSLGAYVQSLFADPSHAGQPASVVSSTVGQGHGGILTTIPSGPATSPQPGFFSRGIWLPLVITFTSGQAKST